MKCPKCGAEMYWMSDADSWQEGDTTAILVCPSCGHQEEVNIEH